MITYLNQTNPHGAFPCKLAARYKYLIESATAHASTSTGKAREAAVLAGKAYHIAHTWMTRVNTCMAVVLRGDLTRPGRISRDETKGNVLSM